LKEGEKRRKRGGQKTRPPGVAGIRLTPKYSLYIREIISKIMDLLSII
jgi:hypothetical protein